MRITLLAAAVVVLAIAATPAAGGPPLVGSDQYVTRNDPRLCPSPLCGGYWVALANRSRTRCSDGGLRPRCYVTRAVDEERHPLLAGIAEGALVRADIEPWTFQGFGELGTLVVAEVRAPVGKEETGRFYRLRDLGVRCIRAPCFSLRAVRLNGTGRVALSDLDLQPARATPAEKERALIDLTSRRGLYVLGTISATTGGGRVLRASRFYLKGATPRA